MEKNKQLSNSNSKHLVYVSYCDKQSLKEKYATSKRINEYKKVFDKIYVFCTDNKISTEKSKGITYFTAPLWLYPIWLIQFLSIKNKSKVTHVKIMEGFIGGLMGFVFSKLLDARLVIRYGARMKENAKYGVFSPNNNLLNKARYLFLYLSLLAIEPIVFKKCKRFICNSQAIVPRFIKRYGVVYNGIDTDKFKKKNVDKLKEKIGLHENKITIGLHGGISETKGIYYLVEALKNFKDEINILFIGDGPLTDYCKKHLPDAKLTGFIEGNNIEDYINCLDIEILPTIKEGNDSFPNSLLEAMACEKLVIGTRVGGIPEMITNGQNGLLIEPNSTKEIINVIDSVIHNKEKIRVFGKNARETITKRFNIEKQMPVLRQYLFG